jgi:hypothetical protein
VVKTKAEQARLIHTKSPIIIGLFCLQFFLISCKTVEQPADVTKAFWGALAKNDLQTARQYATKESQRLLNQVSEPSWEDVPLQIGTIEINDNYATVETQTIVHNTGSKKDITFETYLQRENGLWKVDYQQTLDNMPNTVFSDLFESLQGLGETFNKKLEQQIPLIEKELETFGQQLQEQIEEFNRELEKTHPAEQPNPYRNTI